MFENIVKFFKKLIKNEQEQPKSKDSAKERLHLVLMQDRANVSADFLDLMRQEIIEVIKKYIDVEENSIDVRLTNQTNEDGSNGAPALYANIPIVSIKDRNCDEVKKVEKSSEKCETDEIKKDEPVNDTTCNEVEELKEDKEKTEEDNKIEDNTEKQENETENKE